MPRLRFRMQPEIRCVDPEPASSDRPVVFFLPAHDEAPRIGGVLARIPTSVAGRPVHVVVVDDGSTDETSAVATAQGAMVVRHESNRGLGAAVRTGFRVAGDFDPAVVVFCDADGEYDPAEVAALAQPILDGETDYVVGSRFSGVIEHMAAHRRLGNRLLTAWLRFVTRAPITDGQSGFRALSGRAAARAQVVHDYNYAQVLTIELLQAGFVAAEVPITYGFRTSGTSFVRPARYLGSVVPAVFGLLGAGSPVSPSGRRPRAVR